MNTHKAVWIVLVILIGFTLTNQTQAQDEYPESNWVLIIYPNDELPCIVHFEDSIRTELSRPGTGEREDVCISRFRGAEWKKIGIEEDLIDLGWEYQIFPEAEYQDLEIFRSRLGIGEGYYFEAEMPTEDTNLPPSCRITWEVEIQKVFTKFETPGKDGPICLTKLNGDLQGREVLSEMMIRSQYRFRTFESIHPPRHLIYIPIVTD